VIEGKVEMAEGMFKKPPTGGGLKELSARQQRRKEYLERRGREFRPAGRVSGQGGRVSGQPVDEEGGELTARQQRRRQYLERRDARRERAIADYRAQQQAQQAEMQAMPSPMQMPPMQLQPAYGPMPAGMTPEQLRSAIVGPQSYDKMLRQLPAGVSQGEAVGAAMQEPMRTPTPGTVNAMPGQPRTGTFTPQGMYRPLPFYATPEQIRQRMALIETGGYFQQPLPSQRMR
jgi:hypothetical protein